MKVKVTKRGLVIPKEMLAGVEEVEISKKDDQIVVLPLTTADPILALGRHPIECGVPDGSERHDSYLYGSGS